MTDLIERLNKAKGSETLRGVMLGMRNAEDTCAEAAKVIADQAAEIERLREALDKCAKELEGVARSEFEGVWSEADFAEMVGPYRAALEASA